MELLFRLIEFLVHAALDRNERMNAPVTPAPAASQPRAQVSAARQQPLASKPMPAQPAPRRPQPLVTSTKAATQDPLYDDGWRIPFTVLAIIGLLLIVIVWAVYMMR